MANDVLKGEISERSMDYLGKANESMQALSMKIINLYKSKKILASYKKDDKSVYLSKFIDESLTKMLRLYDDTRIHKIDILDREINLYDSDDLLSIDNEKVRIGYKAVQQRIEVFSDLYYNGPFSEERINLRNVKRVDNHSDEEIEKSVRAFLTKLDGKEEYSIRKKSAKLKIEILTESKKNLLISIKNRKKSQSKIEKLENPNFIKIFFEDRDIRDEKIGDEQIKLKEGQNIKKNYDTITIVISEQETQSKLDNHSKTIVQSQIIPQKLKRISDKLNDLSETEFVLNSIFEKNSLKSIIDKDKNSQEAMIRLEQVVINAEAKFPVDTISSMGTGIN